MKTMIAVAAMTVLAVPAWAQGAAPHDHPAPSQPAAPGSGTETSKMDMKAGMKMGMMEHCKMMRQKNADKKAMDCHAMHEKMHGAGSATPGK